jgi:hypothetical protein
VRALCERYGVPYNAGPLHQQFGSVVKKICRLALPGRRSASAPATSEQAPASAEVREPEMAMAA